MNYAVVILFIFITAFVTAQTGIGQHIKAMKSTKGFPQHFVAPQSRQGPNGTAGDIDYQKEPIKEVCLQHEL